MKTFKIEGPKTTRIIKVEDDEMLEWNVIKITDYLRKRMPEGAIHE